MPLRENSPHSRRLAVLLSFSGGGGVERMMLNLLPAFAAHGLEVDLLALFRRGQNRVEIDKQAVRLIDLPVRHTHLALPAVARYLRRERPAALLAAKDRAIRVAALARRIAGVQTRVVGRLGTHLSTALAEKPPFMRWLRCQPMRWIYPQVDHIVAVSHGVAEDTLSVTGLPLERLSVIRNPVIAPRMLAKSLEPVAHPWFEKPGPPLLLGAGRLTRQKDFATLLRAFAKLYRQQGCRLMILGEGRLRGQLEKLAADLKVSEAVSLPGHVANPHAYMAKASAFVLSSRWEGSPNVLTEALALGIPVVATDCPSGPAEILAQGRYGPLVPVGDVGAMAKAIEQTLVHPIAPSVLQQAVADYTVERSAQHYLQVLGF